MGTGPTQNPDLTVVLILLCLFSYVAPYWEPTSFLSLLERLSAFLCSSSASQGLQALWPMGKEKRSGETAPYVGNTWFDPAPQQRQDPR